MNLYLQIWFYGITLALSLFITAYSRARWRNYYKLSINGSDELFRINGTVNGKKVIIMKGNNLWSMMIVSILWPPVIIVVTTLLGIEEVEKKYRKKLSFSKIRGGCHFICTSIFASKKEKEQVKQMRASRALGVEPK